MLRCLLLLVIAVSLSGAERLLLDDQGSSLVVRLDPPPQAGTTCMWSAQPTTLTVLPAADQARVLLTGPGTVRVTAQVQVPGAPARTVTATWRITARPDRVVLVPATLRLTAGVPATITALVRDQFGSPWAQEVAWSWRCAGATVTGPGATAEVLLGAEADLGDRDVVAEARVPAATGAPVILSGRAPAVVNHPPSLVTATVEPIDARTVDLHLTLADDGPLAAVLVTPTTTGTAIAALDDRTDPTRSPEERRWRVALADTGTVPIALTLTDADGAVATATVAVTTVPVPTRLEVDPPAARLSPGASWRPQARVLDQVGQPVALPVIWEVPETPSVTWQAVEGRLEVAPVLAEHTPARLRLTARVPGTGLTAEVTVDLNHPPHLTADLERDYGIPGASRVRVMLAASDDQPKMTVRWNLPGRTAADEARWLFHQYGMEAQVDLDEAPTLEVQAVVVDADGATTATSTLRLERGVGVLIAGEILDLQALHLRDQVHQPISTTPLVWTLDGPGNLQGAVYAAPTKVSHDQTAVVTAQVPNGPIVGRLHLALRVATLVPHLASGTLLTPGTRVTAELRDGQGALLSGPRLYWTSDPADVLTEDGLILDRSLGAYRITVHAGSLQTSVNVLLDGPPQVEPTATISGPRDLLLTAAITAPALPVTVQWQTQGAAGLVLDDPRSATTTARATAPGPWSATVTVTSASGRSTTATLQGVVAAVPTTLTVAAPEPLLVQQPAVVTVDLEDQFGTPMVLPSNPTWEVSGPAQFASEPPVLTAQAPGLVSLRLQTAGLTATWSGTALHQAPRFGALPPLSAPWGEPLDLIVTAETPSGGPAPTYQITGLPPGITVDPVTGRLHGQAADPGTWSLGLAATTPSGTATAQATLVILPRPADLTWTPPATLVADQPLGPTHLNAEAQTPGTITYDPPAGTRLAPGIRTLTALLVPTDTQRYGARQVTITLDVVAAVPVLTWAPPAPIVAGTPLTTLQLSATANVPGQFVYTPPLGTVLPAGTSMLKVTFLPEDQTSATTVLLQVPLTVLPADGNGDPDPNPVDPLAGVTLVITPDAALAGNQQERDGEMVFVTNQASISLTVGTNVALPEGWNVKEVTITGGESPAKATAFGALTVPLQEGANTLMTTVLFEGPSPQARVAPRRPHGARGRAVCGVSTRLFSLPLTFAAPRAPRPVREAPGNPPNPPPNASRSGDPLPIYRDSTPPTAVLTIPADYPDAPAQALLAPGALAILNQASASDCTTQRSQGLLSFPRNGFAVTVRASEPLSLQSPPTAKVVYEDGTTVSLTVEVTSPNDLRPELRITGFSNLPDSVTYDSQTLEPSESHGRGTVKLTLKDRATTNGGNTATDLPVVQVWSMCTQPPMRLGVQQFQSPVVVPTGSNLAVKDALGESPILSTILTPPTVVRVGKLSQILPGHPGLPSWSLSVPPEASASPKSTFIGWGLEDRFLYGLEVNTPTALSPEVLDVYGNRWKTLFFLQKSLFRKEIASLPALNPGLHSYKHRWILMETTIAPLQDPTIHQSNTYYQQYEITVMEQWTLALRSPLVLPYQLIGEGWLGLTEGYGSDAQNLQLVPLQGSLNELTTLELEISQAYPSQKLTQIFIREMFGRR